MRNRHHFILTCYVIRIITYPESLNGETGLVCSCLGDPDEFRGLEGYEILEQARTSKGVTHGVNFVSLDKIQVFPRLH
jgi:hypothetical protein